MNASKETTAKEVFISGLGKSIKPDENGQRRDLAFYKESGQTWTEEEFINVCDYVGESDLIINESDLERKWVFDDSLTASFMYFWKSQEDDTNFSNCKQVSYESIFLNRESKEDKENDYIIKNNDKLDNIDSLILNPDIEITDTTVIKVESQEQFDKVCEEFEVVYKLNFDEMKAEEDYEGSSISLLPKRNQWSDTEWYQENNYKVLDFNEVFIQPSIEESSQEINEKEIKRGTIVKATRYDENQDYITQGVYYGKCNDEHLIDYNGTHCMVVDKVEVIPTLTKKEAKQKVSELFGKFTSPTSKQIRDIIDLIKVD